MKLIYKSLLSLSALLMLGACSSEDAWQPGDADTSTMGVFFTNLDKYDVTLEVDDPHVFTVRVDRIDDTEAATVPLEVISCPEGVVVPDAVEFAAGETSAYFDIDATDMPSKTSGTVSLRIAPAYATTYGAGTSVMSMNITITGGWVLLADNLELEFYYGKLPDTTTELYALEGSNRFRIPNFLNSGLDFVFSVNDPAEDYPYIIPTTNFIWSDADYDLEDKAWYFYDTAKASYPSIWTPVGASKSVEYLSFYTFDGGDFASWIGVNSGQGELTCYIDFADGSGAWEYIEMSFTPKFNPFTQE